MVEIAAMDANVPILFGMEVLAESIGAIIDCKRGWVAFSPGGQEDNLCVYACEKLSGRHLAVNISRKVWWQPLPLRMSLPPIDEDKARAEE